MATTTKPADVLDGMVEHVRYEVVQTIRFATIGNGWCSVLNSDLADFTSSSILEAALLHFRSLIEFLGNNPAGDRVTARDYVKSWDWKISAELNRVGDVHGRLAHLGTVRCGASGFEWLPWLNNEAPVVLRGFRDFLVELRQPSPRRYQLFIQPREDLPVIDLVPILDAMVGSS
jgi:hypothetical protein